MWRELAKRILGCDLHVFMMWHALVTQVFDKTHHTAGSECDLCAFQVM